MISEGHNKGHQKHTKLSRPDLGTFARNEISITGTTCANIRAMAYSIASRISNYKIAYLDAEHTKAATPGEQGATGLPEGIFLEWTDKTSFQRLDVNGNIGAFQRRTLLNDQDLVLVNGNHFTASAQILVIDPVKDLKKKVESLNNVILIALKEKEAAIPEFIRQLPNFHSLPVVVLDQEQEISDFVREYLLKRVPPLCGLVLSGGQSSRMKKDKGSLQYHGIAQREFLHSLLEKYCKEVFISCNSTQSAEINSLPTIEDTFLNLGPLGGILSAMQSNPNAAWLTVACDLPYLSEKTLDYLVSHRNPSKIATAFVEPYGTLPEPLVTIWEPKAYSTILQFLAQGFSCPRKTLINADIELLEAPVEKEFLNANFPEEFELAYLDLNKKSGL